MEAALARIARLPRAAATFLAEDPSPACGSVAGAVLMLVLVLVAGQLGGLVAALATAMVLLLACLGAAIYLLVAEWPPVDEEF